MRFLVRSNRILARREAEELARNRIWLPRMRINEEASFEEKELNFSFVPISSLVTHSILLVDKTPLYQSHVTSEPEEVITPDDVTLTNAVLVPY